jgi:hypothetical protein
LVFFCDSYKGHNTTRVSVNATANENALSASGISLFQHSNLLFAFSVFSRNFDGNCIYFQLITGHSISCLALRNNSCMADEDPPGLLHAHGTFILVNCIFGENRFNLLISAGIFLFDRCLFDFPALNVTGTAVCELTNCAVVPSIGDVKACPWPDATRSIAATETGTASWSPSQSQSPAARGNAAMKTAAVVGIAVGAVVAVVAAGAIACKIVSVRRRIRHCDTEPLDPVAGLPLSPARPDSDGV